MTYEFAKYPDGTLGVFSNIGKKENGDEYIDDGSLVTDNIMFTEVLEFEEGFNDSVEYILIVAG